jgi:hypothetical protein
MGDADRAVESLANDLARAPHSMFEERKFF